VSSSALHLRKVSQPPLLGIQTKIWTLDMRRLRQFQSCGGSACGSDVTGPYVMLVKVANKDTESVVTALIKSARKIPRELYKSLTWDRGKELADHPRNQR
jgi:hypothetical protein